MTKNDLVIVIITSVICLLPICLSVAVYDELPEKMIMQWNLEINPNWYAHKAVGAFGMPIFLFLLNILINFLVHTDPKRDSTSKVMRIFVQWFVSFISITMVPLMLFMNLGADLPLITIIFTFVGILFIFIGNYLPKNRQNYTMGIRMSWTLNDPENWNKTHRLAGVVFIIGGILFIVTGFLPLKNIIGLVIILSIILLLVLVPIIYSYSLYRSVQKKEKGVDQ